VDVTWLCIIHILLEQNFSCNQDVKKCFQLNKKISSSIHRLP
jgi:hypothetical protein